MIRSLNLKNFQSHKDSTLEFSQGVNIIVGTSDSGKSSIIRALRLAVQNRPLGNAMIRHGQKEMSVKIQTEKDTVERKKGKYDAYVINEDKDKELKAFGTTVPDEINNILQIDEINLQQQLDRPFLISDSPGEVAAHFNKVANLQQIGAGLSNIQKWIKELERNIKTDKEQVKEKKKELEGYSYLEKFQVDLEVLETMERCKTGLIASCNRMETILKELENTENEIEKSKKLTLLESKTTKVLSYFEENRKKQEDVNDLKSLYEDFEANHVETIEITKLTVLETSVVSLLDLYEQKRQKEEKVNKIDKLLSRINNIMEVQMKETANELKKFEEEFHELMPDLCPLCGK